MFRDPEFWKYPREDLSPKLREYDSIQIRHAGCSSGEEVMSMAILLHELGLLDNTKIFATYINVEALSKTGKYIVNAKDMAKQNLLCPMQRQKKNYS